jgi:hypothetical protein
MGTVIMSEIDTVELEKRMRPGAWSMGGFLGQNESLEAVLRLDAEVLALLGVSDRRIADSLERVINAGFEAQVKLLRFRASRKSVAQAKPPGHFNPFERIFAGAATDREEPRDEVCTNPLESSGERCGYPFEHLRYSGILYCGYQTCPWGCDAESDLDFKVENERAGEVVKGPGLIVHLIREHHFFEGLESPYRVSPIKLVKVLELRPETLS